MREKLNARPLRHGEVVVSTLVYISTKQHFIGKFMCVCGCVRNGTPSFKYFNLCSVSQVMDVLPPISTLEIPGVLVRAQFELAQRLTLFYRLDTTRVLSIG